MTGRFARQQIELRTDAFWRRHWRRAVPGVVGACVLAGAVGLLIPVSFPMGVVYPLVVLAVLSAMRPYFYGTYHLEMGAEAEGWTSKELRRACGTGWHVVDGISFAFHDVDHVLVGPGGIIAVETKFTDSSFDLADRRGAEWATRCAEQAAEGAHSLRHLLWHQTRHQITPLVVVWGVDVRGAPTSVGGMQIVGPRDLRPFLSRFVGRAELSPEDVERIRQRLVAYRASSIKWERENARERAA